MKSYLVDTSVIIDYLRGKKHVVELLNNLEGEITSSYFCLSELYEGVYRVKDREQAKKPIDTFFTSLSEIYSLDEPVAEKFGQLRAVLKQKGTIIEDIDLYLAATCLVYNLTLVTLNKKHFSHIDSLNIH